MDTIRKIPQEAIYLLCKLNEANHEAYLVGGCIRDWLMGRMPHDWDLTTSAYPQEVAYLFRNAGFKVIETGLTYGTVTVISRDGNRYEITTFRKDGDYSDCRRPEEVYFCDRVEEDLSRRDFTMNAIAWSPATGLVDPFHGAADIEEKVIRCVGDPYQRFQKDALRILRAFRFSSVLGFGIESHTLDAARASAGRLEMISAERRRDELMKLLVGSKVQDILMDYPDIIGAVIPEILPCVGFEQYNPWHVYNVWDHIAVSVGHAPKDPIIRLTMLLHDIGKPDCFQMGEDGRGHFHGHGKVSAGIARTVLSKLRFDNETIDIVVPLVEVHDLFIEPTPKAVRRLLNKIGPDQFDRLMEVRKADVCAQTAEKLEPRLEKVELLKDIKKGILSNGECFTVRDLAVNGMDLIGIGFKPGPEMGKVLNCLLASVMEEPDRNKKETLLAMARGLMASA